MLIITGGDVYSSEYGEDSLLYYHYWFEGKRLLQRPITEVLSYTARDLGARISLPTDNPLKNTL